MESQSVEDQNLNNYKNIEKKDKSNIDLAVLLLGIFSFIIPFIGWILSLAGIITYFFSNKTSGKAIAGLILSIASRVIAISLIILIFSSAWIMTETSNSLQEKAFEVGMDAQSKLVMFLTTDSILAKDTSDGQINANVDNITLSLRTGTEVSNIKLDELTIQMFTKDGVQNLQYNGDNNFSLSTYGVRYNSNGGVPKLSGYLTGGEVISLSFTSMYNITEKDKITIRFSPKDGQTLGVDFIVPDTMTNINTQLYP